MESFLFLSLHSWVNYSGMNYWKCNQLTLLPYSLRTFYRDIRILLTVDAGIKLDLNLWNVVQRQKSSSEWGRWGSTLAGLFLSVLFLLDLGFLWSCSSQAPEALCCAPNHSPFLWLTSTKSGTLLLFILTWKILLRYFLVLIASFS